MVLGIPTIICIQKLPILSLGHELCPPPPPPPPPPPIECFAKAARYGTFFTYFFLILTPVNHLLDFQYSRYANYSLIMQKYQKQGLQELVVPVLVPTDSKGRYRYRFGWYRYRFSTASMVPVPPQRGTGTGLRFCREMAEFTIFHALFFHNSLLFHSSSKTNMESLKATPPTLLISQSIQGFILKFTKLYKTLEL